MTDGATSNPAADLLQAWFGMWTAFPKSFNQPILPGWTFGNVIVDENNSSAPDTERSIVSTESYGRQLGKLMDAVCALIDAQPATAPLPDAYIELKQLKTKIDALKTKAARRRIEQFLRDLKTLKDDNDPRIREAAEILRSAFSTSSSE